MKIKSGSVFSGVFDRGAFLSLLVFLLLGLAAETKANVIQANNSYPPPNGSFQSPGPDYNFGSGVTAVQFTNVAFTFFDSFVLVAGPVPTLSFNAQFSHYLSTDGGNTWSGEQAATAHFVVALGTPTGNSYPFQITSLTISGGDLPASFQLQLSGALPGTPVVTFTPSGGLVSIDNTFYLPLELSQDGGSTWTPNTVSGSFGTPAFVLSPLTSEELSHSPTLPPGDGQYYTPAQYHAAFASGIIIRNPIHNGFLGQSCGTNGSTGQPGQTNSLCPPPILGGTSTEDFTSQMNFDIDMPATTHIGPIGASVETRVTHMQDFGTFQIYKTQMINLDPNPGTLPAGMNFRINPDPNKPSLGMTTIRPGASANETNISSAFALRIQMTTDGGVTWQDSDQFTRMSLRILPGTGFPTTATNGTTFSIGVFEVVVDPNFAFLFAPAPTYYSYYPGYGGTNSGILTSPVMYDSATMIGESVSHVRDSVSPTYFPVAAGTGVANYPPPNSSYSNILSYADYAFIPPVFTNGTDGVDEILTEIEQLNLQGYVASLTGSQSNLVGCPDPRVPSVPLSTVTVKAGPGAFGIGANLPLNRRSIGMVQQITNGAPDDFPAQSFFDIFVEVSMPQVPGTVANTAFPASGAVLYNDASDPLLIENLSLTNLPPEATYVHGNTTAVPIRFRDNNPPYWSAGDVLGYLTLAGHGVFTNVITAQLPCAAATATGGLLDQTLGPIGSPMPRPPIPWLRQTNTFPSPGTAYGSMVNRPVDSGITNYLDDQVSFTISGLGMIFIRDVKLGGFSGSIQPPSPLSGSGSYTDYSAPLAFEISVQDGVSDPGFYPYAPSAPGTTILTLTVTNTPNTYTAEMVQMSSSGIINGGDYVGYPIAVRESPTLQSLGRHTIAPDPRGYRVSSFFDVFLELSMDGGETWTPANNALRLHATMPPPTPQSIYATQITKTNLVLNWQNSFTLQSATNVLGPWVDLNGAAAPATNSFVDKQRFYRLRD